MIVKGSMLSTSVHFPANGEAFLHFVTGKVQTHLSDGHIPD
jgi:hypothetical protein